MDDAKEIVMAALRNPKYLWRTVRGIEKETGLAAEQIEAILISDDGTIRSSSKNEKGERLYASRDAYRKKVSPLRRLSSVLRNRGD